MQRVVFSQTLDSQDRNTTVDTLLLSQDEIVAVIAEAKEGVGIAEDESVFEPLV